MGLKQKNVGIIGCGMIGHKRSISLDEGSQVSVCCDIQLSKAKQLAEEFGGDVCEQWQQVVDSDEVDILVIATTHNLLAEIALAGVKAGKPILLEKPGARRAKELDLVLQESQHRKVPVHVGFNHRFHPAMLKARDLIEDGALGELFFIRGRYGHGGRVGYEQEWRADPEISGGGELLDQGAHLIDLCHWYFNEKFVRINGEIKNYFWDMPVEDNAFLTLVTDSNKVAHLHVTWTEWKNLFSLEITGRKGKLHIEGLGGSYGTERLAFYKMKPEMGPPDTKIWEWPGVDLSWKIEWDHFLREINSGDFHCNPGLRSAQEVLGVIETIYQKEVIL
jgi:predicted dehydrogenase